MGDIFGPELLDALGIGGPSHYDEIRGYVDEMAKAALRADLEHEGWRFTDDGLQPPLFGGEPTYSPDYEPPVVDLVQRVQYWSGRISDIFADWLDLPDPTVLEGLISDLKVAGDTIAIGSELGDSVTTSLSNEVLAGDVTNLSERSEELGGATAITFHDAYAVRLGPQIGKLNVLTRALAQCAELEREIFARSRTDVTSIFDDGLKAMRRSGPKDDGTGIIVALVVVGAAAAIASAATGGATAVAFAAVAASAGATETLAGVFAPAPPVEPEISGDHPEEVCNSIEVALNQLNGAIRDQEYRVRDLVNVFVPGDYLLPRPELLSAEDSSEIYTKEDLVMDGKRVHLITTGYIPNIAATLLKSASGLGASPQPWNRPDIIGLGTVGPYYDFDALRVTTESALRMTASQVAEAGRVLADAWRIINSADGKAEDDLATVTRRIQVAPLVELGGGLSGRLGG